MLRPYQRDLLKSFQELPQKELILSFKNRQLKARGVGFFLRGKGQTRLKLVPISEKVILVGTRLRDECLST